MGENTQKMNIGYFSQSSSIIISWQNHSIFLSFLSYVLWQIWNSLQQILSRSFIFIASDTSASKSLCFVSSLNQVSV